MKRKFKLITSVASLCIAIALMAFGVYAATAPSVTVNGSVSFDASNVLASYKAEQALAAATLGEYTEKASGSFTTTTSDSDGAVTVTLDQLSLTDVNVTASYRFTITSDFDASSAAKVIVTVTAPADLGEDGVTEEITYSVTANGEGKYELTGGQSLVVTYTVTVDPAIASSFAAEDRNFKFDLARG